MGVVVDGVNDDSSTVGDDDFFKHTPSGKAKAAGDAFVIEFLLGVELREDVRGALDGAGDNLWEETYEEGIVAEVLFRVFFPFIYVDYVACGLECVERDAEGEEEFEGGESERRMEEIEDGLDGRGEEAEVFEGE